MVECAFGRLKARFGCLRRVMNINLDELPAVIYACFVLHNYCELNKESINEEMVRTSFCYDHEFRPQTVHVTNWYMTDAKETEGKRSSRILNNYFDP